MKSELDTEKVTIDTVSPHPKNVRQGDIGAISESLTAHGQYRAIVAQRSTGHIIAGNHTWKAAKSLGWSHITVHWLDADDDQAMRILLADNRANDLATYDDAALSELLTQFTTTEHGLTGTLFDGDALDTLLYDLEQNATDLVNRYSQNVKIPHYEVIGEQPTVNELSNMAKYETLVSRIEESTASQEVKDFLLSAATRHIIFDYRKIAEFYPHASSEIQQLMEESALVIIDANDAITNGFARFVKTTADIIADESE